MTSTIVRALAAVTFSMAMGHCAGLATTPVGKAVTHAVSAVVSAECAVADAVAD